MLRRLSATGLALTVSLLACTGGGSGVGTTATSIDLTPRGGTVRVGVTGRQSTSASPDRHTFAWDPQVNGTDPSAWELTRCCLGRTLLSYRPGPTAEGGTLLRPDLAAALPEVSSDGLTWTFHLRPGLHYAPPLQDVQITAGDFVRALERELDPRVTGAVAASYWPGLFYGVIEGAKQFADGTVSTISGLEVPDPLTLRVTLSQPFGDLAYLLAFPVTAPIPPNPAHPDAAYGVAQGHDHDFTGFTVSSGPYMLQGSAELDFSRSPEAQATAAGVTATTMTLVRNPSWDPVTDGLRPAYADQIVLMRVRDEGQAEQLIDTGALDLVFDDNPADATLSRYRNDPQLQSRLSVTQRDTISYVDLNVAVPPFDDIHVRRAIDAVVDRHALVKIITGSEQPAAPLMHMGLDSQEAGLLTNYTPGWAGTGGGSLAVARAQMRASAYDHDRDGRCDGAVCENIRALAPVFLAGRTEAARSIAADLRAIGIRLKVIPAEPPLFFSVDPSERIPVRLVDGFIKDYPSAASFYPQLFGSEGIGRCCNASMLGASPHQLEAAGYAVRSVPSVDARIAGCSALAFEGEVRCWADFDQYLMEEVMPAIPLFTLLTTRVFSGRVARFTMDQAVPLPWPALDAIAVRGSS